MISFIIGKLRPIGISPIWVRFLPSSSRRFGPPRKWGFIKDVVPRAGGRVIEVEPAETVKLGAPHLHGSFTGSPIPRFNPQKPATSAFTLPEARLIGPDGIVVTKDDCLIYDTGFWSRISPKPKASQLIYRRKYSRPIKRLSGTCISLGSDFAVGSYGHFVHDGLARLHLVEKAGFSLADADWIFLPRMETSATEALCSLLNVPRSRILNYSVEHDYECERLIATSFPGAVGTISPGIARFLQNFVADLKDPQLPPTRIYLSRRGYSRNPTNAAEFDQILKEFGFVEVDPASGIETIAACARAQAVIGVDGSNMANAAFAPAGAKIIIIYPSEAPPQPYHTTLCLSGNRELHLLMGEKTKAGLSYTTDFHLNTEDLRACLTAALNQNQQSHSP